MRRVFAIVVYILSLLLQPSNGAIVTYTFTDDDKTTITEYVNVYRRRHQAPDVAWDDAIMNAISQPWAESLSADTSTQMEHTSASSTPSGTGYGENLAWFSGFADVYMDRMRDSVDAWYNEVDDMDWSNVEPGAHHSGVVGHFTCLVWVDQQRLGFGYAYNNAVNEINVNQNVQDVCNVIGSFADNVLPAVASNDDNDEVEEAAEAIEDAAVATGKAASTPAGTIVAIIIGIIVFILLVFCQYPFMIDELNKRPHVKAHEEEGKTLEGEVTILGTTGLDTLFTWSEWCSIQGMATKDCFVWYGHAAVGGETACCGVLKEKESPEYATAAEKCATAAAKGPDNKDPNCAAVCCQSCWAQFVACCCLWARALKVGFCECWKESNEEIDHHEERKEGHSWCERFWTHYGQCWVFYGNSVWQTCLLIYKYTRRCCIATHKAVSDATASKPKDGEDKDTKGAKDAKDTKNAKDAKDAKDKTKSWHQVSHRTEDLAGKNNTTVAKQTSSNIYHVQPEEHDYSSDYI